MATNTRDKRITGVQADNAIFVPRPNDSRVKPEEWTYVEVGGIQCGRFKERSCQYEIKVINGGSLFDFTKDDDARSTGFMSVNSDCWRLYTQFLNSGSAWLLKQARRCQ